MNLINKLIALLFGSHDSNCNKKGRKTAYAYVKVNSNQGRRPL